MGSTLGQSRHRRSLGSGRVTRDPQPVERDSRGIIDPWLLRQRLTLTRYPPTPALSGLVDRFWAVRWELPAGVVHRQQVLTHPGANITVGSPDADVDGTDSCADGADGPIEACLEGVQRQLTTRALAGRGLAVAAMTLPGGLGAFTSGPAADLTDRSVPLGAVAGVNEDVLIEQVCSGVDEKARVAVLAGALERALRPDRVAGARRVVAVARLAEHDRSVRRLGDLSSRSGIASRSLQRLFPEYAGVSPMWVLRRYRLLDAAEAVRSGEPVSWSDLAAELGYADQSHLIREFSAALGQTPATYASSQSRG